MYNILKQIRSALRRQLGYVKRDLGYLEQFMSDGYAMTGKCGGSEGPHRPAGGGAQEPHRRLHRGAGGVKHPAAGHPNGRR